MTEVKVTRGYQVTIPKDIREPLRIKIGDTLPMKKTDHRIVIETRKKVENPSKYLWNISKKPSKLDVVKLIKESRKRMG